MKQKQTPCLHGVFAIFYSKHNLIPNQTKIIDIADSQTSTFLKNIMSSISDRSIWCSYGLVRMSFKKEYEDEEFLRKIRMEKTFDWATKHPENP